ncbi:unnamed protein product, partial [Rotaria socialis]
VADEVEAIRILIIENKSIREILSKLRRRAISLDKRCKAAKTIGKGASTLGSGLSLVAPFTGGLMVAFGTAAAALSIFGSAVETVAEWIDHKKSAEIFDEINSSVNNRKYADYPVKILKRYFKNSIEYLVGHDINKENAIQISLKQLYDSGSAALKPSFKGYVTSAMSLLGYKISKDSLKHVEKLAKPSSTLTTVLRSAASLCKVVGLVAGIVSTTINMIDFVQSIGNWTKDHPTVKVINDIENVLEDEAKTLHDLYKKITSQLTKTGSQLTSKDKKKEALMAKILAVSNEEVVEVVTEYITLIHNNAETMKKESIKVKTAPDKDKTKDNHVINKHVIQLQRDLFDAFFAQKCSKTFSAVEELENLSETRISKDYHNPFEKKIKDNIAIHMKVTTDAKCNYFDYNAVTYGPIAYIISSLALKYLEYSYKDPVSQDSTHMKLALKTACKIMNSKPYYVDEEAKKMWLLGGPDHRKKYEDSAPKVFTMFSNLPEHMDKWVEELKHFLPKILEHLQKHGTPSSYITDKSTPS